MNLEPVAVRCKVNSSQNEPNNVLVGLRQRSFKSTGEQVSERNYDCEFSHTTAFLNERSADLFVLT